MWIGTSSIPKAFANPLVKRGVPKVGQQVLCCPPWVWRPRKVAVKTPVSPRTVPWQASGIWEMARHFLPFTINILSGLLPLDPPCHPIRQPPLQSALGCCREDNQGHQPTGNSRHICRIIEIPWRLGSALPFHPDSRSLNAAVTSP